MYSIRLVILYILSTTLSTALATPVDTLEPRSSVNGPCTGSGGAAGVCISTSSCTKGGGNYISNACPGTPANIKCCTKTSCGSGGNCRFTSKCSTGNIASNLCPGPTDFKCCLPRKGKPSTDKPISRSEIMSRGQYWIKKQVKYSQKKTYPDPDGVSYRTDCSGFVSMTLRTWAPGRNTVDLIKIVKEIKWEDLQPGDLVGTLGKGTGGDNGHVTLFHSWVDAKTKKEYKSIECKGGDGCVAFKRPVGWETSAGYKSKPYRYIRVK